MGCGASAQVNQELASATPEQLAEVAAKLDDDSRQKVTAALASGATEATGEVTTAVAGDAAEAAAGEAVTAEATSAKETTGETAAAEAGAASDSSLGPNAGPVSISVLRNPTSDFAGMQDQPVEPKYKVALVGCYVKSLANGGSDKLTNGHRFDSIPIANGMINAGMSCQIVYYDHEQHADFFQVLEGFDAVIVRCNPGQINAAGGDQKQFDDAMMKVAATRPVWPTPEIMAKMGAKDALCCIKDMDFGLPDTLGYYSPDDMRTGFKKTIAFQPRVVKQNRGSAGEGIWIVKLKSEDYCKEYGEKAASDDDVLILTEANDSHVEEHTVAEFIEFCVNGRSEAAGEWKSIGTGKYFEGGKEAGGQMVDQRFLPRIDEGEARFMMVGMDLYRIEHYVYVGGVGGETRTTIYEPDAPEFADTKAKLQAEVPEVMKALGLGMESLPLLWAADFIPVDNHKTAYVVGEFNCSCLGVAGFLNARGKDLASLSEEDKAMGQKMVDLIGQKALAALEAAKR